MNTICNICNQPISEEEREWWTQGIVYHESCYLEPFRGETVQEANEGLDAGEKYDCPIHGRLGFLNFCPRC